MKNTIFVFLISSSIAVVSAQKSSDIALLQRAFAGQQKINLIEKYAESRQNPNELQSILSGLFLTYKAFVSSQDQNKCNFAPSCSEYGLQAVKKFGIIKGGISTLDRMTRCNGLNLKNYPIDPVTLRLSDPVKW